jgi:hypothetical protein
MKEIANKQFTEIESTATLLQVCLNFPPQGGFDLATIRARNKVADAAEKARPGDTIALEDADFATAQAAIKQVRWGKPDRYLIQFAEQFGL